MRRVAVCPGLKCSFSKSYGYGDSWDDFCPRCARELLYKCPECGHAITEKGATFCSKCARPLKGDPPEEDQVREPQKGQ